MKRIALTSILITVVLLVSPSLSVAMPLDIPDSQTIPPDQGPGGPILVITNSSYPFSEYYAEILRNEGLNEFGVLDISQVNPSILAGYDLAILGEMPLTNEQVSMIGAWVDSGGNLIAMRPDKLLAGLLGLSDMSAMISNGYLLVDTSRTPGTGIVNQTMQFHGTADLYALNGATSLGTLYSDSITPTNYPAVSINYRGSNGGKAAAFAFDLARSVVYTHQGNPEWAGQKRNPWISWYVALNLFYPDWIDFNKIAIPQADEQQRLLANLVLHMNLEKRPLPRFWYFPRGEKAVVVLTGDDHTGFKGNTYSGNTATFFERQKAKSPAGCSVENWECVRSSSYMYVENPLTDVQAADYTSQGFEIGVHVNAARPTDKWCDSWTSSSLLSEYQSQLDAFYAKYASLPIQTSERSHCHSWYLYADQPAVQFTHGIRMDTNVPYWPGWWVLDRPGFMLGSVMPMRFADIDGNLIDVYQAHTIMTDDNLNRQRPGPTIRTLLDWALGSQGYYGVFTVLTHSDNYYNPVSYASADLIITEAQSRGVPVISGRQLVEWLDSRNSSYFQSVTWDGANLSFQIIPAQGANGLQAMIPANTSTGQISNIIRDGIPVFYAREVIKGIEYAIFEALEGTYSASYTNIPITMTPTPMGTPTNTALPTAIPTSTTTPTATNTALPTAIPTSTTTPTVTNTALPTATRTSTTTPTATNTPLPTGSPTPSPTPTPTLVPGLIFADGFESGNLSSWSSSKTDAGDLSVASSAALDGVYGLQAVLDDSTPLYLMDDRPDAEKHYMVQFLFDPNSITMSHNDSHTIFIGYAGTTSVLHVLLWYSNGQYYIRVFTINDGGTLYLGTSSPLNDAPHMVKIDWQAATDTGTNDGSMNFWVDGLLRASFSGIDNDTRQIDTAQIGAVRGIDSGTRGTYYFDAFESWH